MSAKKLHPQADYVLDLLVAAGHITREKAFQASDIAVEFGPQEAAAVPAVGQEAMLKALKFHPSASHVSPDFRDHFNATLQQHFDNYVRYGAALAGGDGGEG